MSGMKTSGAGALIVFAKKPEPGRVKTRLQGLLSGEESAALYEAFLLDALDDFSALPANLMLYFPEADWPVPPVYAEHAHRLGRQRGHGLGEKMENAFMEAFRDGYRHVVIVGTDHPTLQTVFVARAFRELAAPGHIVIGPSDDGGYYLLGMNAFYPALFRNMTYSHPAVFSQTLQRGMSTGAGLVVLPGWYDVDTPGTLYRLAAELQEDPARAPRTASPRAPPRGGRRWRDSARSPRSAPDRGGGSSCRG
jgi:uncharacterized protein